MLWVPALVAIVMLVLSILDQESVIDTFASVLSGALMAALQVAFWVTAGFSIAERTGSGSEVLDALGQDGDAWGPADLPAPQRRQVAWGDAIWGVIGNAFVLILLVLPFRFGGQVEGVEWARSSPAPLICCAGSWPDRHGGEPEASLMVLARGRWTWSTAIANLVGMLLFTAPVIWLASRNDLFAWDTLPLEWIRDSGSELIVNESATLGATIVILLVILLWETFDTFRKAARSN